METLILGALGVTSVIALAFIVERAFALHSKRVIPSRIENAVSQCRTMEDLPRLKQLCEQRPSPISRLVLTAINHLDWPRNENVEIIQTRARHEINMMERGLIVLEICTGVAPLMGLVGTIYGMIALFGTLGEAGLGDHAAFAAGISIALRATLFGLIVAIPSLIAWSYFNRKVESLTVNLERICDEFVRHYYLLQRKAAAARAQAARQAQRKQARAADGAARSARPQPGRPSPAREGARPQRPGEGR